MLSKPYPHPEEHPEGASRRTQGRSAALHLNSCPASRRNPPFVRGRHEGYAGVTYPKLAGYLSHLSFSGLCNVVEAVYNAVFCRGIGQTPFQEGRRATVIRLSYPE